MKVVLVIGLFSSGNCTVPQYSGINLEVEDSGLKSWHKCIIKRTWIFAMPILSKHTTDLTSIKHRH